MLTRKQRVLLLFINNRITETGVPPSYEEMKDALDLASKSGVHRMIISLEERGFIRRLQRRARAIEVLKLPEDGACVRRPSAQTFPFRPEVQDNTLPVLGRIAAGVPIEALQNEIGRVVPPFPLPEGKQHFGLQVRGDSMIDIGILDGDTVIMEQTRDGISGDIVVALIDQKEATLKRLRKKGASIALESENTAYKTRIYGAGRVQVQGRLVALVRQYRPF